MEEVQSKKKKHINKEITTVKTFMIVMVTALLLSSCAHMKWERTYTGTIMRFVDSPTGTYMVVKSNCMTVQHIWEKRAKKDRKHIEVESLTDTDKMEIWYCTEAGLKEELHNIQSFRNLMEAAQGDYDAAFPLQIQ